MAFFGSYRAPHGLIFIGLLVGAWSLGRRLGPEARRQLVPVIVTSASICAAVGCLQVYVDLGEGWLEPFQDRAIGLMSNPVHLAGLCTGAGFLAALASVSSRRRWVWLASLFLLAAATQVSGSRVGIVALFVALIYLVVRYRRAAVPALLVVIAAVALTVVLPAESHAASSARLAEGAGEGGLASRLNVWTDALEAVVERPLPRLRAGALHVGHRTADRPCCRALHGWRPAVRRRAQRVHRVPHDHRPDRLRPRVGVGHRRVATARGPLVGFCLVVFASMLFEPQFIGLTPIVLLALGAAGPRLEPLPETPRWNAVGRGATTAALLLALIGGALGISLLVGDSKYATAVFDGSVSALDDGEKLFPPWPQFPALRGVLFASAAEHFENDVVGREALRAEVGAIHRDPYDPQWWWLRGQLAESFGTPAQATAAYRRALELNPWSAEAMVGMTRLANKAGDRAEVERWRLRLCKLGPSACLKKSQIPASTPAPAARG